MTRVTRPLLLSGGAYGLALAAIALWPRHVDAAFDVNQTFLGRWLLGRGFSGEQTYWLIELVSNIALYLPLGIFAMALVTSLRWWDAVGIALVVSASFELLQGLLPDRTASAQDILANTLGAGIGAALVVLVRSLRAGAVNEGAHRQPSAPRRRPFARR